MSSFLPIGSNGQVCSGQNGFCIPIDDTEEVLDTVRQTKHSCLEYRYGQNQDQIVRPLKVNANVFLEPVKLVMFHVFNVPMERVGGTWNPKPVYAMVRPAYAEDYHLLQDTTLLFVWKTTHLFHPT